MVKHILDYIYYQENYLRRWFALTKGVYELKNLVYRKYSINESGSYKNILLYLLRKIAQ